MSHKPGYQRWRNVLQFALIDMAVLAVLMYALDHTIHPLDGFGHVWLVSVGILLFAVYAVLALTQDDRPCVVCATGQMYRVRRSGRLVECGCLVAWSFQWRCCRCHARRRVDAFGRLIEEEGGQA